MSTQTKSSRISLDYVKTIGIVNNGFNGRGFANPYDLTTDDEGRIFVLNRCDPARASAIRVGICNLDDEYLGEFGRGNGSGDGQFTWAVAMAKDRQNRLHITDEFNHRVTTYTTDGEYVSHWGKPGANGGELNGPAGIAVDSSDNLFIVDQNNSRVQKFTTEGEFIATWGEFGNSDGQFNLPWGVAVDRDDNVYIADWGNERVQILGPDGSFQLILKGEATLSKWAEEYLASNPEEKAERDISNLKPNLPAHLNSPYHISSQTEPYFWGPVSVTIDKKGRLYVTETNRHRFQVYQTR